MQCNIKNRNNGQRQARPGRARILQTDRQTDRRRKEKLWKEVEEGEETKEETAVFAIAPPKLESPCVLCPRLAVGGRPFRHAAHAPWRTWLAVMDVNHFVHAG